MNRWAAWALGAALVVAAWGVALITPAEDAEEAPFPITVEVGERGAGRNIAVTVTDVRRTGTVTAGEWSAEGNWLIVDLEAEAVASEFGALLAHATLELDGRSFRASERPESLLRAALAVGIPRSGSLAFELPAAPGGGAGELRLGVSTDERLDSVIVVPVDLDDAPVEPQAELQPTGWSTP
jgi:hypothetical protein